ncbi:glucose-1-phosphate thymidylyltransferase RfbA [Litorimonas haliclonae]|uniref:glucose-1-phosphate thymidylyltransferase RfbA n=1 Tax=Litorimonas haliclonae TaxID=2081977 RepID=UPI0039F05EDB
MQHKGIILAGGTGTRLHPSTISVSKQLMPIYDKPMIYYPLSVLMQAGIREVLIITTPHDNPAFVHLLGDGKKWGMTIKYAIQDSPDGLAQALIIGEEFLDGHPSCLILGDNLFFGLDMSPEFINSMSKEQGATIFGYEVKNANAYGVVGFDSNNNVISLEEKPEHPDSNYAVTGLYFYDNKASEYARTVTPSARGELEITTLNQIYLDKKQLTVKLLDRGTTWLDTGTHRSLLYASQFVQVIEQRQGKRICCPEMAAYENKWITREELHALAEPLKKSGYGEYLLKAR